MQTKWILLFKWFIRHKLDNALIYLVSYLNNIQQTLVYLVSTHITSHTHAYVHTVQIQKLKWMESK